MPIAIQHLQYAYDMLTVDLFFGEIRSTQVFCEHYNIVKPSELGLRKNNCARLNYIECYHVSADFIQTVSTIIDTSSRDARELAKWKNCIKGPSTRLHATIIDRLTIIQLARELAGRKNRSYQCDTTYTTCYFRNFSRRCFLIFRRSSYSPLYE